MTSIKSKGQVEIQLTNEVVTYHNCDNGVSQTNQIDYRVAPLHIASKYKTKYIKKKSIGNNKFGIN